MSGIQIHVKARSPKNSSREAMRIAMLGAFYKGFPLYDMGQRSKYRDESVSHFVAGA
jgi:hypothetical protein